jgi:hypothetical protein
VILVDTSVWVDHLRRGNPQLSGLLDRRLVSVARDLDLAWPPSAHP